MNKQDLIKHLAAHADVTNKQAEAVLNALTTEAARNAVIEALALSAAPAGWKLVPVNPTPEMWKAAKSVPDPNPPYPPHYGLVWDAMLAASPTPPAEQQATKETSGGFHVWRDISTAPKDGSRFVAIGYNYGLYSEGRHICVAQWFRGCWMEASDWNETSELKYLTHWMPLPSPPDDVAAPAEQPATTEAATPKGAATTGAPLGGVYAELPAPNLPRGGFPDLFTEGQMRDFADRTHALRMEQAAPKAASGVGNSGFDHKTAADFLNGKTISDEAVRKFVQASRWAHDEKAALSAMLLSVRGVLASREAEIALLKKALLEAETAPQPAPAPLSEMPYEKREAIQEGEQIGASDAWFKARHEMLDTVDRRNVFRAGFDRGWSAAIAAQGGSK